MRIGPETEKKAAAALQKLKDVDAADDWDKLTETDFYWAVVHCVNEYMNLEEVWNRPIIDLPWSVDEWREEVRANTRKAYDMFLGYMPSEYKRKFSESKAISADRIANYLSRCWESRDFYEGWNGRWKWRYSIPGSWVPPYEEREQYVLYLQSLESNGGEEKMDTDARIREMIEARELIRETTMAKLRAKARLKANRKVKAEAKGTAKGDAKGKDLTKAKATLVYSTSQHAEAAGPSEYSMDASPDHKPDNVDEASGPTVVGAQKMLSELHL